MSRPTRRGARVVLALLGVALAGGACASAPASLPAWGAYAGRVVDARTGRVLDEATLAQHRAAARVILVGEQHADPGSHAVQREVLERVLALGATSALGVEWLPRSTRLALAGFGVADPPASLDELRRATRWDEVWGHDLAPYAPLVEAARRHRVPIVPLNAEPGLARLVGRGGVEAVPPERKAELPPLDSGNAAHRAWFSAKMAEVMHGHPGMDEAALERFYLAQLVWDETMAGAVRELAPRVAHVVVCAGSGHVERGLGIAARVAPLTTLVVLPAASLDDARARVRDAAMPEREADLFWVVPAGFAPSLHSDGERESDGGGAGSGVPRMR